MLGKCSQRLKSVAAGSVLVPCCVLLHHHISATGGFASFLACNTQWNSVKLLSPSLTLCKQELRQAFAW